MEIHTLGGWTVTLKAVAMIRGNVQDERQLFSHLPDVPTIPFRLEEGGFGLINTANIYAGERLAQTRSAPRNRTATGIAPVDSVANQKPGESGGGDSFMKPRIERSPCSASANSCSTTRTIRTFLAEDSPLLMVLLARIVSKDERVAIVGSATDGRRTLCNASTLRPDLVITDLHMPGVDGAEVARRLKQRPNPPIIFVVTSDDTPEARTRCQAAGADAFLVKAGNLAPRLLSVIQEFFPDDLEPNDAEPKHFRESLTTVE